MPRTLFLSLDGLDGSGKSTQCRLLAEWLRSRGFDVTACADPGGTPLGGEIRALLLGHRHERSLAAEAMLFMASRAELVARVIRPALDAGRVVVSDRFLLANVAYQGYGGGLDPEQLWSAGRLATGGLEPELTLVLDLPVEAAQARWAGPPDRLESRDRAFHGRVREGFLAEARKRPDRVRVVDAGREVRAVHEAVCQEVSRVLGIGSGS
jgi:dTMP kinase